MSENTVTIDADRLLQWGIDAFERGRASMLAETLQTSPAGQRQTFLDYLRATEDVERLQAENDQLRETVAAPKPYRTVSYCRVERLEHDRNGEVIIDTVEQDNAPLGVTVTLSDGNTYRGAFK